MLCDFGTKSPPLPTSWRLSRCAGRVVRRYRGNDWPNQFRAIT
jgi:hypothetical protein